MIPRILIDKAPTPGGGKELKLYQHDKDFIIIAGTLELMNSRAHESEDALARLAVEKIKSQENPRVLVGGLGMGFTLRAALDGLPKTAEVLVAEIVSAVVRWNHGVLGGLTSHALQDPRVRVYEVDVAELIKKAKGEYDAILLDMDNGPAGLSLESNDWFYGFKGLHTLAGALRPGGVLGIWSAGPDNQLTYRLKNVGFLTEEIGVRARPGGKGAHHSIWLAVKR